jgi:uracil-DNA glycosylase family 4
MGFSAHPLGAYMGMNVEGIYRLIEAEQEFSSLRSSGARFVPGEGSRRPALMMVGEAPGAEEDRLGRPFVGRSGQVLDDLLASVQLHRSEIWITNVIKYRPPANRTPTDDEIEAAVPYLMAEIDLLQPPLVLLLGASALAAVFPGLQIRRTHGVPIRQPKRTYLPLYHPAVALYKPIMRKVLWADFAQVADLL